MNYNTAFCLVCSVRIIQIGEYCMDAPAVTHYLVRQVQISPHSWGRFRNKGSGLRVSSHLGYTSTPLMSDPSKTMVKS